MKSWKEAAQSAVAIVGVAVIVSYGYGVTQQCQRLEQGRSIARLAIDNTQRIATVVGGSARILDAVSDADVLNSVHDVMMYSSFPPSIAVRPAAVLNVGGETLSYLRESRRTGNGRSDGQPGRAPQSSRGKIGNVVEYLSKKVVRWVVG